MIFKEPVVHRAPALCIRTRFIRALPTAAFALMLTACATPQLKDDIQWPEPAFARPPAENGVLAETARAVTSTHTGKHSGFKLLNGSRESMDWRLALIDSAVSSIDIQTYLWYPDSAGMLLLERVVRAAEERGVHVRLIVDDLLTIGQDQPLYELNQRPNIEVRLFNPWRKRNLVSRGGEMIVEMQRLNFRMHDKLLIADGHAAVIGGRNIGDHYFGLSHAYNFHDLDVLGFGHLAQQTNQMFDSFWNSNWVVSVDNFDAQPDPEFAETTWTSIIANNAGNEDLDSFHVGVQDWTDELEDLVPGLHIGTSEVIYDEADGDAVIQNMALEMFEFFELAQEELLVTNAYIIPNQDAIDRLQALTDRGVDVRILTNSLASHDVPAVNSHYKGWRDDFIEAGAELYELRADAAIKETVVEVPPVKGRFVGLHTKAAVIDRELVFIGSMNFDPRSFNINTEDGALIRSPGLARELVELMEQDMHPDNAWQVLLDEDGDPYWINSDETVNRQPARNFWQRVMDLFFRMFPKELY